MSSRILSKRENIYCVYFFLLSLVGCASIKHGQLHSPNKIIDLPNKVNLRFGIEIIENRVVKKHYEISPDLLEKYCITGEINNYGKFKEMVVGAIASCHILHNFQNNYPKTEFKVVTKDTDVNSDYFNFEITHNDNDNRFMSYVGLFTLFVVPIKNDISQSFQVTYFQSKKIKKTLHYNDGFTMWYSLFLVPVTPFVDGFTQSMKQIHKNLVENVAADLD